MGSPLTLTYKDEG